MQRRILAAFAFAFGLTTITTIAPAVHAEEGAVGVAAGGSAQSTQEAGPTVRVTIAPGIGVDTATEGVLERRDADRWTMVCEVPCDRRLDRGQVYRLSSTSESVGWQTTPPFRLGPRGDSVAVRATFGSPFVRAFAVPTAVMGTLVTVFGVAMLFSDKKVVFGEDGPPQPTVVKTLVAGTITGLGASLVIGGALMFFVLGKTSVDVTPSSTTSPSTRESRTNIRWNGLGVVW